MRKFLAISLVLVILVGFFLVSIKLMFPKKYSLLIDEYSVKYGIPSSMVYSVINVESGFDEKSISHAGAIGLMQILPSTADDCAKRIGIQIGTESLYDPETNINIGCYYLAYLLEIFEQNVINSLCAYNWGLGNVKEWISLGNVDDSGTITNIPVKETRNYIKKYKINLFVYKNIF